MTAAPEPPAWLAPPAADDTARARAPQPSHCVAPTRGEEVLRFLRSRPDAEAWNAFVSRLRPESYASLFRVEVSPVVLAALLASWRAAWRLQGPSEAEAAERTLCALNSLSLAGRFSLAVCLLSNADRKAARALFDELREAVAGDESDELRRLRQLYAVD